jgi:hypothetical protein
MLKNFLSELNHALHYHLLNPYKRTIAFIPRAIEWVKILWDAQTAIEGFNNDGEELVEGWLVRFGDGFKPGEIPLIVNALMFLQPELLQDWLDNYEPGQDSSYSNPEQIKIFGETYGGIIRRSQEAIERTESRVTSSGGSV